MAVVAVITGCIRVWRKDRIRASHVVKFRSRDTRAGS